MIDKVFKYIKTVPDIDKEIFEVNNDNVKNKVDDLVFQYIKKHFTIKKRISKENIMTCITVNYTVKAVSYKPCN